MAIKRQALTTYLNDLLDISHINDYCPNGLQVEGCEEIHTIVTGVTACYALLKAALKLNADAIIVHHGYFWKGENQTITGIKRNRLNLLLANNVNLFAYHLPLDVHSEFGNNMQLAKVLDIVFDRSIDIASTKNLLALGHLKQALQVQDFAKHIHATLNRQPLTEIAGAHKINKVAWCTGAAQDFIEAAYELGADAYLTGEVSERTIHSARENNIHFFACGHHATERYGVKALGEHLAEKFNITHHFIDIDNPV